MITPPDHLPMKPTFSSPAAAIARDRAVAVLVLPPCLNNPPDETKAPTLPERKAMVAMAARAVGLINMLLARLTLRRALREAAYKETRRIGLVRGSRTPYCADSFAALFIYLSM